VDTLAGGERAGDALGQQGSTRWASRAQQASSFNFSLLKCPAKIMQIAGN